MKIGRRSCLPGSRHLAIRHLRLCLSDMEDRPGDRRLSESKKIYATQRLQKLLELEHQLPFLL